MSSVGGGYKTRCYRINNERGSDSVSGQNFFRMFFDPRSREYRSKLLKALKLRKAVTNWASTPEIAQSGPKNGLLSC